MENPKKNLEKEIKKSEEYNKSINAIIIKYKDGLKTRQNVLELEQPTMVLLRNGRKGEILEATKRNGLVTNLFKYKHSNGEDREVDMEGAPLYELPYGEKKWKTYIHHEDHYIPFNLDDPICAFNKVNTALAHTFSSLEKWKVEKMKAFALNWKYVAFIILAIGVVLLLYWTMGPKPQPQQLVDLGNQTVVVLKTVS